MSMRLMILFLAITGSSYAMHRQISTICAGARSSLVKIGKFNGLQSPHVRPAFHLNSLRQEVLRAQAGTLHKPATFLCTKPQYLFVQRRRVASSARSSHNACKDGNKTSTSAEYNLSTLPHNIDHTWLNLIYAIITLYQTRNHAHAKHGLVMWHELMFVDGLIYALSKGMIEKVITYRKKLKEAKAVLDAINSNLEISVEQKINVNKELDAINSSLSKIDEIVAVLDTTVAQK